MRKIIINTIIVAATATITVISVLWLFTAPARVQMANLQEERERMEWCDKYGYASTADSMFAALQGGTYNKQLAEMSSRKNLESRNFTVVDSILSGDGKTYFYTMQHINCR